MPPLRNRSTIPAGMLHPAGLMETPVVPAVQATTRPAGGLLRPSPGYDTVRRGKNRFQGKGPSGGFRTMEFAEDVGGTGAALSITPGTTSELEASEWLPENADSIPEGSMILADREFTPGSAEAMHEGYRTIPDMGDRHPGRPLSRLSWHSLNPVSMFREEYAESPAMAVAIGLGLVFLVNVVLRDFEGNYRGRRGVTAAPAAASETGGEVGADAIDKIGQAADQAVEKIGQAADKAAQTIENVAEGAKTTVTGE